jgi:diguanylate cyclase (GGDEF)-like protein/PAS domain S-box-containing protein
MCPPVTRYAPRAVLVAALPAALVAALLLAPVPDPLPRWAAGWGLAAAGAWSGVLVHRRAEASADPGWQRVARTVFLWTAGQILFAATGGTGALADASAVLFLLVGLSAVDVVLRSPSARRASPFIAGLDALAAGLALVGLLWDPVVAPGGASAGVAAAVFPLVEVAVVALGLSILGQSGGADRALVAIVVATSAMLVGDLRFLYEAGHGGFRLGTPGDAVWPIAVGAVAVVAATGTSRRRIARRWWHQAFPAIPIGLLAAEALRQQLDSAVSTTIVLCGVSAVLVHVVRQLVLHQQIVALTRTVARERDHLIVATDALAAQERRWRSLILHSSDVVVVVDEQLHVSFTTPSIGRVLGYGPDEQLGQPLARFVHPDDIPSVADDVQWMRSQPGGSIRTATHRYRHADGRWLWMEATATNLLHDPDVRGIVCNLRDVTDRVNAQELLRHQATHDALTRLPNRAALRHWVDAQEGPLTTFGLVLLDLDGFKEVNDALGHTAGDELLCRIADRLRTSVRGGDMVGRLGGDEFAAVVTAVDEDDLAEVATRLLAALEEPVEVAGWTLTVTASGGGTIGHGRDLDGALQRADIAMYRAKRAAGGGAYATYGGEDERDRLLDLELTNDLRQAIADGEVGVWYQVKIDARTGEPAGVEALARWRHPVHGDVPPATFVALAERAGLVGSLTDLVLGRATTQAARWRADGLAVPVAVNVSPVSLRDRRFAFDVLDRLVQADVPASLLEIEITEAAVAAPTETVLGNLARLRAAGVRVAVDDFGTGYSNLSYLKELPVDILKIDRSFVSGLATEGPDRQIVAAICALGTSLGLTLVAEGVETDAVADRLLAAGCTIHQGYLHHRPSPSVDVTAELAGRWNQASFAGPAPTDREVDA